MTQSQETRFHDLLCKDMRKTITAEEKIELDSLENLRNIEIEKYDKIQSIR